MKFIWWKLNNYLLTYDSYVPLYNRFHRGEWITRVSGGEGALDTPGPLNGTSEAKFYVNVNEENPGPILLCGAHTDQLVGAGFLGGGRFDPSLAVS